MRNDKHFSVVVKSHMDVQILTSAAFLTALSIVLTRFASVMALAGQVVRIGLGSIPIIMAGLLLGPVYGGLVGLAADLLGVMINPMGQFHPGFTLTSILLGLLPGLIVALFGKRINFYSVFLSWLACTLICAIGLQTLWLAQMQGLPYLLILASRMILLPWIQAAHLLILLMMMPVLQILPVYKRALKPA